MRFCTVVSLVLVAAMASAQSAPAKKKLTPADMKAIVNLTDVDISKDGRWLRSMSAPAEGDPALTIRNNDAPTVWTTVGGQGARFTEDSAFAAYLIAPPKEVADRMRAERKPIQNRLGIRRLESGEERIFDAVEQFFLPKGSRHVLARRYRPAESRVPRNDLMAIDLVEGSTITIGNVANLALNESETRAAIHIRGDNGEQGVQIFEFATGKLRPVHWGKDEISGIAWAKDRDRMAVLLGSAKEGMAENAHRILIATVTDQDIELITADPMASPSMPKGFRVSDTLGLRLSDDGSRIAFGIAPWRERARPTKPDETANVEIWNWKDIRVVPEQRVRLNSDRRRSFLTVWEIGKPELVQVQKSEFESVQLSPDLGTALVLDSSPYAKPVTTGWEKVDVLVQKTLSNDRKRILENVRWGASLSRTGRYVGYFKDRNWWVYDIGTDRLANATATSRIGFDDPDDDYTTPERAPAGSITWAKGDRYAFIGDRYDEWRYEPTSGALARLTDGAKEKIAFSIVDIDRSEDGVDGDKPLFFSMFSEESKVSGYARREPSGDFKVLAFDDRAFSGLRRAPGTDRVVFVMQRFDESPNAFITNDQFAAIKPVTKTNPQLAEYLWPKSELVSFKSRWGKPLQGVLTYPADYQPGRRYPMVVYIYERLSQGLNNFARPLEWQAYSDAWFAQNGYFVFKPDIAYRGETPGENARDCIEPAVEAVLKKNVGVDRTRMGITGHSWGGYQTAFMAAVSPMFKAAAAGAPLTEMTSMYNLVYWNSGTPNAEIFESSQGRMGRPFWEIPKTYFDNSPIWQATKMKTPILLMAGDQDGAVDYRQSVAFYLTLRRMGKECVFLVYPGENHNLARRSNQLDYAHRLRHFFDVHLKGAKPEPWLSEGQPFIVGREEAPAPASGPPPN